MAKRSSSLAPKRSSNNMKGERSSSLDLKRQKKVHFEEGEHLSGDVVVNLNDEYYCADETQPYNELIREQERGKDPRVKPAPLPPKPYVVAVRQTYDPHCRPLHLLLPRMLVTMCLMLLK